MAAALPWIVPAAVGALGLVQSNNQANAARHQGQAALAPQVAAQKDLYNVAHNYNPAAEDQQAIQRANQDAGATFGQSLGNLNGSFTQAGGQPTGDTAFNVSATNAGNRAIDPLRAFTTQLLSTESQRKADMLGRVFGAPAGQVANSYFQIANGAQGDANNSLGLFIQGLKAMPWLSGGATGQNIVGGGGGYSGVGPPPQDPGGINYNPDSMP